jgi:hypothetical protein
LARQGDTPAQALSVRCDAQPDAADIVVEVGLAVRRRGELRVLRIAHRHLHG